MAELIDDMKYFTIFEESIHDIIRTYIKIDEDDRIQYDFVFHTVLDVFIELMKSVCKMFKSMNPRIMYMGSKFEGLRVGMPSEYDVNIVLSLPICKKKIVLDSLGVPPAYAMIKTPAEFRRLCTVQEKVSDGFARTQNWCNRKNCLMQNRFRSWMQSVIDKAFETLPQVDCYNSSARYMTIEGEYFIISKSSSGPANTITVDSDRLSEPVDIDLVPTMEFSAENWPRNSNINFTTVKNTGITTFFVVPKPHYQSDNNNDYFWRLTFPDQERELLKNRSHAKIVIRLIKQLRDAQEFDELASYYIKTLFLLQFELEQDGFWDNPISYLLYFMLSKLKAVLRSGVLPCYWDRRQNLIANISQQTRYNWSNRIQKVINVMLNSNDPDDIIRYFVD